MKLTAIVQSVYLGVGASLFALSTHAATIEKAVPITIVVNQSPWYKSFERLVQAYEKESGNKVNFDVNPMPATQEKQRNSLRAAKGDYDLMPINSQILDELYRTGLLEPMENIDPSFKLSANIPTFSGTACWDAARKAYDCKSGKLMGVPIMGNVQLLFYRKDLYDAKGLKVPATMADLGKNAAALNSKDVAGFQPQDARGAPDVSWGFMPFLHAWGGQLYKDADNGDYTVTMNSPQTLAALDWFIDADKKYGSGTPGTTGQGKLIQLLTTGKVAQGVVVIAAWAQMDDPTKSVVAGKIDFAPIPAGPVKASTTLGHFIGAIPKNIPEERKKAAMTFLKWFQTTDAQKKYIESDGVPVDIAVLKEYAPKDAKYRWAAALATSYGHTDDFMPVEGGAVVPIMDLRLNQAVIGELKPKDALNLAAKEMAEALKAKGYKTGYTELK
ncbi:MAG: extracellular solute-binding protein [Burkholderiaceae bacterium]